MEPGDGREGPLGVIADAAVRVRDGRIVWLGCGRDLPSVRSHEEVVDAGGGVVMPGLVDCHTHLVHGGWRADEYAMRSRGKSYAEIASAGGGIMSTVRATRAASAEELFLSAAARADEALSLGTTTVEIKTGYGQDVPSEFKMAEVIAKLSREHAIEVVGTFLGLHALPPEFEGRRAEFVRLVCEEMLPAMAAGGSVTSCDAFVEEGAFTADEARALARAAEAEDLPLRLHVDQFHDGGGASLAAELCAISADHLDFTSEEGMMAMAEAGVVAVCLPGASFFAGKGRHPDARRMIDIGCTVAVSTDYNPGTSPSLDLFLAASMAVAKTGMTCEEALAAITKNAAAALALSDRGALYAGKRADLIVLDCESELFPLYRYGSRFVSRSIVGGKIAFERGGR